MTPSPASRDSATSARRGAGLEAEFDVAVVGCGPVGALLAILLGRAGHRVVVFDRFQHPYPLPRAVVFDDEIARVFAAADLAELIEMSHTSGGYEWHNAHGQTLLRFDHGALGPSGWPAGNMFGQPELEAQLAKRLEALPTVTVLRGYEIRAMSQDEGGVLLHSDATADGQQWRARYAVGCDGANSFVRTQMATELHDLGFFYDWLVVDVVLDEDREFTPDNLQICDPARPTTAVSGGPGRRRWEFMRLPHETIEELDDEATAWRLLEPWKLTPDNARLERHVVYRFQARWAERWRDGRLLIAGDAAHLMPPFAGQGMCSGLRDAANLAWKFDLLLSGRSPDALLDTYETERSQHVQHAIGMSMALGAVICATDPESVAERDAAMLAAGGDPAKALPPIPPPRLPDGLLLGATSGPPSPPVGNLTPQSRVRVGDEVGRFDQVVGTGFVIASSGDPTSVLRPDQLEALARIEARLVEVVPAADASRSSRPGVALTTVADIDDEILPHLAEVGVEAIVVRPDFYLFGTAAAMGDLPRVVDDLLAQLGVTMSDPTNAVPDTRRDSQ